MGYWHAQVGKLRVHHTIEIKRNIPQWLEEIQFYGQSIRSDDEEARNQFGKIFPFPYCIAARELDAVCNRHHWCIELSLKHVYGKDVRAK